MLQIYRRIYDVTFIEVKEGISIQLVETMILLVL